MHAPLPDEIIRAYDIRGTVPDQIDAGVARQIGAGFGRWLRLSGGSAALVGRDARVSSPVLYEAAIEGLRSAEINVHACGLAPTPVVGWAVDRLGLDGGLIVTASHNPPNFNGFKLLAAEAVPLMPEQIGLVASLAQSEASSHADGRRVECDALGPYLEMLEQRFGRCTDRAVAVDPGNGAAGRCGPQALLSTGAIVHAIRATPRPVEGRAADPQDSESLRTLASTLRTVDAELGIAWDGDGDRIGVLDHLGQRYEADWLTAILARPLLARRRGAEILLDMKTSSSVIDDLQRRGGTPVLSRTGYSFFRRTMRSRQIAFGGETSGHIMFGPQYRPDDDAPYIDDGVYAACALLAWLSHCGRSLAEEMAQIEPRPISPEFRLNCPDHLKASAAAQIGDWFERRHPDVQIDRRDGARVTLPSGWLHARASNTAPALSLRFEASDEASYRTLADQLGHALAEHAEVGGIEQLDDPPLLGPQIIE